MRIPKYLSPSSISKFFTDPRTFYIRYLCETRTEKPPQQDFMAVGSAFDGFVKHAIHLAIFGEAATKGSEYDRDTIFEAQVEEHVRDVARERGEDLFSQYEECGAFGALLADVAQSPEPPQMEFTVKGLIEDVPLLGKPDLRYMTPGGVHVISDWKVNGSTSKYGASPYKGYQVARDIYGSNTNGKPHKIYQPFEVKDLTIQDLYLEDKDESWADQLAIYGWLLGEPIGSEDYVVRMEQVACRPVKTRDLPRAKFATHMNRISKTYQKDVLARATQCWSAIQSGHIFTEMTREESDEICEILEGKARTPVGLHPALASCYGESTRFK